MLAAAPRTLRLVRKLVPAVAFGMSAHATVGALVLDAIMWSWSVTILVDLVLLFIWSVWAGVVRVSLVFPKWATG